MLGIAAFIVYFIIQVIIENKSLSSILRDFQWAESEYDWTTHSKNEGVIMTSDYSMSSFTGGFDHLSFEFASQNWLNNFVFDRKVVFENVYFSPDKASTVFSYNITNDLVDITQEKVSIINPAVLRYLKEIEKTSLSSLSVYLLARLFQDRDRNMGKLRQSYATEKILLRKDFSLGDLETILNNKFDYNSVNYVKLFLDEQFGIFNDVGLYYWLQIVDYFDNKDQENYLYYRTKLENFLKTYNSISAPEIVDFILFDKTNSLNLHDLFNEVKTDYYQKIKGLCGEKDCTDNDLNLLQWGSNIFNQFLSDSDMKEVPNGSES